MRQMRMFLLLPVYGNNWPVSQSFSGKRRCACFKAIGLFQKRQYTINRTPVSNVRVADMQSGQLLYSPVTQLYSLVTPFGKGGCLLYVHRRDSKLTVVVIQGRVNAFIDTISMVELIQGRLVITSSRVQQANPTYAIRYALRRKQLLKPFSAPARSTPAPDRDNPAV